MIKDLIVKTRSVRRFYQDEPIDIGTFRLFCLQVSKTNANVSRPSNPPLDIRSSEDEGAIVFKPPHRPPDCVLKDVSVDHSDQLL